MPIGASVFLAPRSCLPRAERPRCALFLHCLRASSSWAGAEGVSTGHRNHDGPCSVQLRPKCRQGATVSAAWRESTVDASGKCEAKDPAWVNPRLLSFALRDSLVAFLDNCPEPGHRFPDAPVDAGSFYRSFQQLSETACWHHACIAVGAEWNRQGMNNIAAGIRRGCRQATDAGLIRSRVNTLQRRNACGTGAKPTRASITFDGECVRPSLTLQHALARDRNAPARARRRYRSALAKAYLP